MAKQINNYITEGGRDLVKVIIGVAIGVICRESHFNWKAWGGYLGAKPIVFITEDRTIRSKAAIVGVAVPTIFIIKQVLNALKRLKR